MCFDRAPMTRPSSFLMLIVTAAHANLGECASPVVPPCSSLEKYVFCEDWSSGHIRPSKWKHEISATGGGNSEFQIYSQHPQNSFVANGTLHLRPSFTYHTMGDLRGDLNMHALGCTNDWNQGCMNR